MYMEFYYFTVFDGYCLRVINVLKISKNVWTKSITKRTQILRSDHYIGMYLSCVGTFKTPVFGYEYEKTDFDFIPKSLNDYIYRLE